MKYLAVVILSAVLAAPVLADDSDDTLRYYTQKSQLVAVGTIVSVETLGIKESGVQPYSCKVKIKEVPKGAPALAAPDQNITLYIERFENSTDDRLDILRPGSKCIFFLAPSDRSDTDRFNTVDMWFGIQPYNSHMVSSIKRISQPKKK